METANEYDVTKYSKDSVYDKNQWPSKHFTIKFNKITQSTRFTVSRPVLELTFNESSHNSLHRK
jgi:hypothetical protein